MGVLITGGMGVLGSMVTEELVGRGERVVLYARHFDRSLLAPEVLGAVECGAMSSISPTWCTRSSGTARSGSSTWRPC